MSNRQRGGRGLPAAPLAFLLLLTLLTLLAGCDTNDRDAPGPAATTGSTSTGTRTAPARERYHREQGQPYRFENSPRGLRYAKRHGYAWIDIDSIHCRADDAAADGRPVPLATHWPRIDKEGFDPLGRYPGQTRWTDLTLAQVRALRTADDPPYRVLTMVEMVEEAARVGLTGIEWEIKDGDGFTRPATYRPVLRAAQRWGIEIEVKTIHRSSDPGLSLARLRAAKQAGATTMLLNVTDRPIELTSDQQRYVDFVRGHGGWRSV